MQCPQCNRLCDLLPGDSAEEVTVEQIESLIQQSREVQYPWKKWWLIGGEPTLHPYLDRILEKIAFYRDTRGPNQFSVGIATHGYGEFTRYTLQRLKKEYPFLEILNSEKTPGERRAFVSVLDAAVDRFPHRDWASEHWQGCGVSWHCGIGMNYAGFFPCCVAGAMYRAAQIGNPIQRVAEITVARIIEKYAEFCRYCGYYLQESKSGRISNTWRALLGDRVKTQRT